MREEAKEQARRNIDAFGDDLDAIVVNVAGCGAAMREYGDLLADDAEWAERARAFSAKVRDISEYLQSLGEDLVFPPLKARAVYQDACHLAHAQGIRSAPRSLLGRVPDLDLVELAEADTCCGSAGIYNITHREASMRFLDRKMELIGSADPDLIITGNVGCLFQLDLGVRRHGMRARVIHTVDALSGVGP
jgi:glycolate oxidase iron-sulfur subunit